MTATASEKRIWTIGHSTHPLEEFLEWLDVSGVKAIADIRSYPGSRRYPHFNQEALELSLPKNGVSYYHFKDLGGRRKARPDSVNKVWRHPSFRGYADYMETEAFKAATQELKEIARQQPIAMMCAEAVWWSCHRSMVSDYLKAQDWEVLHIMGPGKITEHPYTSPANIENGKLIYKEAEEK